MTSPVHIIWPILNLFKGDNQFVGIMTLSALLKKHGFRSEAVEADYRQLGEKLATAEGKPVLAFSTPTIYARTYLELARKLKKDFTFTALFGGPHPTYFPDLIEEDGVDGICIGEGEYPMLDFVQALARDEEVSNVPNWWVKQNGNIIKNELRPLIQDLDELPLPDHAIIRQACPSSIWQAIVMTSRGCPYSCSYCYNHLYRMLYKGKGHVIRRRSVDHVMAELREIRQHDTYRFIRFMDDLFILDREWVLEFSERYRTEIGLPFSCLVRANLVTHEIIAALKKAGCWRIMMGVEAGDEHVRNVILNRKMDTEEIIGASRIIKECGLKLVTANILGNPGSTFGDDLKTIRLNMDIKPDYASFALLQPYPGTAIYDYAKSLGMIDAEPELNETTVSRSSSLKYPDPRHKMKTENLQKLSFIAIEVPFLFPLVVLLTGLPLTPLYHFLFSRWVNYCQYFRAIPPRIGLQAIWKRSRLYHSLSHRLTQWRSWFSVTGKIPSMVEFAGDLLAFHLPGPWKQKPSLPRHLVYFTTYQCNSRCVMCRLWKTDQSHEDGSELTPDQLDVILSDSLFSRIKHLDINGGESFLRSDLVELIDVACQRLPRLTHITMSSNGLLTGRIEKMLPGLIELARRRSIRFSITLSIHGIGKTLDAVFGIDNAFARVEKTIAFIRSLEKENGPLLTANCVLTNVNISDAERLLAWSREEGIPLSFALGEVRERFHNEETAADTIISEENRNKAIRLFADLAEQRSLLSPSAFRYYHLMRMLKERSLRSLSCHYAMAGVILGAYGELYYCPHSKSLGNSLEVSAKTLYFQSESTAYQQQVLFEKRCADCPPYTFNRDECAADFLKYLRFSITGSS